jgi:hypothetical protein
LGGVRLFIPGKSYAIRIVADIAITHSKGILAESGIGSFHFAFEKIRTYHTGATDPLGVPKVKYIHSPTFCYQLFIPIPYQGAIFVGSSSAPQRT